MIDPLEQLLFESRPFEDDVHEAARKAFEDALEHAKTVAKCIPDDNEDLAEEKRDWTIQWDGVLKVLWDAMAAARKLGAQVLIEKPVLTDFKKLKETCVRWKTEAQLNTTPMDVCQGSSVAVPGVPAIVGTPGSGPVSERNSLREVSLMTRTEKSKGNASTEQARNSAQDTTVRDKVDDPEAVRNETPCERCTAAASPCWGVPGRACDRCKSISQRCTKSSGRGGARPKRKRDPVGDAEYAPEASKPLKIRITQKRRVSSPLREAQDDNDEVEVIDAPSANSKGKQKANPSKPTGLSKPSVVVTTRNSTARPTLSNPSVAVVPPSNPSVAVAPQPEQPNPTAGLPREILKTLGELEVLVLSASAEVKHAQAETKRAEGTLDSILSEIRSFRTKHDI